MQSVAAAAARGDRRGSNGDFSRCKRFCLQPAWLASGFCCGKRIDVMRTTRHAARATPHRPARSPRAHSAVASPALPGLQNRHATSDALRTPAHRTAARDHALRATGRGIAGPPQQQARNLLHASASISAIASAPCVQRHYLPGPSRRAIFTGRLLHRPRPLRRRDRSRHFLTTVPPAWRKALREARRRIENLYRNSSGRYESHWMLGFVLSSKWRVNQIEGG